MRERWNELSDARARSHFSQMDDRQDYWDDGGLDCMRPGSGLQHETQHTKTGRGERDVGLHSIRMYILDGAKCIESKCSSIFTFAFLMFTY